jgi:hypothetical protein
MATMVVILIPGTMTGTMLIVLRIATTAYKVLLLAAAVLAVIPRHHYYSLKLIMALRR